MGRGRRGAEPERVRRLPEVGTRVAVDPLEPDATFVVSGPGSSLGDTARAMMLEITRRKGTPITPAVLAEIDRVAAGREQQDIAQTRKRGVSADLRKLLDASKKRDAVQLASSMVIRKVEFVDLVRNASTLRYRYTAKHLEHIPPLRKLDEVDRLVTDRSSPEDTARVRGKVRQMLAERIHRSVHLFEDDRGRWHCFYLTFRDVAGDFDTREHHWKCGSHIHYVSHLFAAKKEWVLDQLELTHSSVTSAHIRFVDE